MPRTTRTPTSCPKAPAPDVQKGPLTREQVRDINAWWRAANYLSACQLYLLDNPCSGSP